MYIYNKRTVHMSCQRICAPPQLCGGNNACCCDQQCAPGACCIQLTNTSTSPLNPIFGPAIVEFFAASGTLLYIGILPSIDPGAPQRFALPGCTVAIRLSLLITTCGVVIFQKSDIVCVRCGDCLEYVPTASPPGTEPVRGPITLVNRGPCVSASPPFTVVTSDRCCPRRVRIVTLAPPAPACASLAPFTDVIRPCV